MPNDITDGIADAQCLQQTLQGGVLRFGEGVEIRSFKFDPDREIIAASPPPPTRYAGMPRTLLTGDKLGQDTVTIDQEMRRYAQRMNATKIGVMIRVQTVLE